MEASPTLKIEAKSASSRGSALIYILIAIALLGILTASLMDSSSQQTTSQNASNLVTQLNSQLNFIRSAIQECILTYPAGDTTMPANPVGQHSPIRPYPIDPHNTYLASPNTDNLAKWLRCPGNPGNSNNHAQIFAGNSGKFMPPPPKPFSNWYYRNDSGGIYLLIGTTKSDAYLETALSKLDQMFAPCEASYIDATAAKVQTDPGFGCWAGYKCFVVRIATTPTTLYPQEASCP